MLQVVEYQRVSEHQCVSGHCDSTYGTSSRALDFDIANGVTPLMYSPYSTVATSRRDSHKTCVASYMRLPYPSISSAVRTAVR